MITQKKMTVPIFDYKLTIVIFDKWEEVSHLFDGGPEPKAITATRHGEALEIVDSLKRFTDKEKRLSKYAACQYLNVSRATFDNYVREGKLPRGKHEIGFKELSWDKKELDEFVKKCRTTQGLRSNPNSRIA